MARYRVLGPLEVEVDGAVAPLPAPKHRALLLALLLRGGAVRSTDQLIDALWEEPPASAGKLLQAYVSQLRSVLGARAIETMATGYRLDVDPEHVDARRFERLLDDARTCLQDGNPALAATLATRGLALWRGPALSDVAYADFAAREAERLEELRLQCEEVRLDAELAMGRAARVLADLTALCRDHPEREPFHERLALALYRAHRQSDALAALAAARRHLLEHLGLEPGRALKELERAILEHDPSLDPPTPDLRGDAPAVPRPAGELVGRRRELDELHSLVVLDEVRLLTVTGAGGTGKTRIALELATQVRPFFANGAVLVELAPLSDPALVMPAIAQALRLAETAEQTAGEVVVEWLQGRQVLLVLDTFEHVVEAAREVADLVLRAPLATVLVTSRRVLHVSGERVYPLGPLTIEDASRLFTLRAEARAPSLVIDPADEVVRDICRRLDCLPLALEIAAARTMAVDPWTLRERLRTDLGSIGPGPRDAPARQQTLASAIQWTTDQLHPGERRALARLSVFVGGCDLATAQEVCDADLDTIAALVDWSLVQTDRTHGVQRYTMLDTIRHHAEGLLDGMGERADVQAAHARHFLALVEATFSSGAAQPETLRAVDPELDNLRIAYERSRVAGDDETALRLATSLYSYWYVRGLFREGRDRIIATLGAGGADSDLHTRALRVLAGMHYLLGEDAAADRAAQRGITIGTATGALEHVMACHTVRGVVAQRHGDFELARAQILASAALAEQLGRDHDRIISETNLGDIALNSGHLGQARHHFEVALEWHRRNGTDSSFALLGLGTVARHQGLFDEADRHLAEALEQARRADRPQNAVYAELGQAVVAVRRGDIGTAGRLLGAVQAGSERLTGELVGVDLEDYREVEAAVLHAVGPGGLAALLADGAQSGSGAGSP